jgi:hypothetical protein
MGLGSLFQHPDILLGVADGLPQKLLLVFEGVDHIQRALRGFCHTLAEREDLLLREFLLRLQAHVPLGEQGYGFLLDGYLFLHSLGHFGKKLQPLVQFPCRQDGGGWRWLCYIWGLVGCHLLRAAAHEAPDNQPNRTQNNSGLNEPDNGGCLCGFHAHDETWVTLGRQALMRIGAFLSCSIQYARTVAPSGEMTSPGRVGW